MLRGYASVARSARRLCFLNRGEARLATLAEYDVSESVPSQKKESSVVPFDWTDPLRMSLQLNEEEILVAQTAEAYAKERLLPGIVDANRNEKFDRSIMTEMGELGLLVRFSVLLFSLLLRELTYLL